MTAIATEPHHGYHTFMFTAADSAPETSLLLKGPTGGQPGAEEHVGAFRIPHRRQVSFQVYLNSDTEVHAELHVRWYSIDHRQVLSQGSQDGPVSSVIVGPVVQWGPMDMTLTRRFIPSEATHWRPLLVFRQEDGEPLVGGTRVLIDCLYLPDSGLSLVGREYLDGDQPYGSWEGASRNSSSVYDEGQQSPADPPPFVLSDGFIIDDETEV